MTNIVAWIAVAVLVGMAAALVTQRVPIRDRWNNLPPSVKKAAKPLMWAIVTSIVLTVLAYYAAGAFFHVDHLSLAPEKVFSFIDAVLAGIVAFALLGAFTFLASVRRPEEEALDDRIAFLYSARREDGHEFNKYLKEQVMLLGACVTNGKFKYEYVEISADGKFLRTIATMSMCIVNTMKHDTYRQTMPLKISIPATAGVIGTLGKVFYVQTRSRDGDGNYGDRVELLPNVCLLTASSNEYRTDIELEIPPAGELTYEYMFEGWEPASRPDFSGANRFIERAELEFVNSTTQIIHVDPTSDESRPSITIDRSVVLNPGESSNVTITALPPSKVVAMAVSVHNSNA
ncbi:MAG: hypothetical protein ACTHK2_14375 [Dokdonella sp.]|uniref:hypothetical protein n=1 Tax=Dokdonella sp. TaxID=2291710 RepID=UPI003F81E0E7